MTSTQRATVDETEPARRKVVLSVENLSIAYETAGNPVIAVDEVSFDIHEGETFGLAGESGSGKSTIANAILQLLGGNGRVIGGSIHCGDINVSALSGERLRSFRWNEVSMVFQSAMNSLNPVMTIGDQIIDVLTTHRDLDRRAARVRATELLDLVGIDAARISAYPHQLSGGMRQRAVIAIALALEPSLLIMDEPTTALDVVVQQEIIHQIKALQDRLGFAILFITHDLSLMVEITQRLGVMRNGRILEMGDSRELYNNPQHKYTRQLIEAFPPIRSDRSSDSDSGESADPAANKPVVVLGDLSKVFQQGSFFSRTTNTAVDQVSFTLHRGEIMALVGESGSGKSTIARMLARLEKPTSGRISVDGFDVLREEPRRASRRYRGTVQMVFQDPFGSLNPTKRIRHFVERPLALFQPELSPAQRRVTARELLESVELNPDLLDRYPHELSGGQRQRIAVARALAVNPKVILADEPTSMLDVSVRMGVLLLLKKLRDERGISILYITHDLASARFVADTTVVMLRGALVEGGPSASVMDHPEHPYTRLLLSAAPDPSRETPFDRVQRDGARREIGQIVERRAKSPARGSVRYITDRHWISTDGLDPN